MDRLFSFATAHKPVVRNPKLMLDRAQENREQRHTERIKNTTLNLHNKTRSFGGFYTTHNVIKLIEKVKELFPNRTGHLHRILIARFPPCRLPLAIGTQALSLRSIEWFQESESMGLFILLPTLDLGFRVLFVLRTSGEMAAGLRREQKAKDCIRRTGR